MKTKQTKPNHNEKFKIMKTLLKRLAGHQALRAGSPILNTLLLGALTATAAPGSWTQKAEMPAPTSTPVGCPVDGIL